jgi:hypothetical protein
MLASLRQNPLGGKQAFQLTQSLGVTLQKERVKELTAHPITSARLQGKVGDGA